MTLFSRFMISVVSLLVFEYLVFPCDRFKEPKIDLHAPYEIQDMETKRFEVPNTKDTIR